MTAPLPVLTARLEQHLQLVKLAIRREDYLRATDECTKALAVLDMIERND